MLDGHDVINSIIAENGNIWVCYVKVMKIAFSGVWHYSYTVKIKVSAQFR
jgi:hypothetical protein